MTDPKPDEVDPTRHVLREALAPLWRAVFGATHPKSPKPSEPEPKDDDER